MQVSEIVICGDLERLYHAIHQEGVHPSAADRVVYSSASQRALDVEFVAQKPCSQAAGGSDRDIAFRVDFQHTGGPASELGGEGAFVDHRIADRLALERGEEAEDMSLAVDRDPVQKDQVLVGTSTPDVHS